MKVWAPGLRDLNLTVVTVGYVSKFSSLAWLNQGEYDMSLR